LAGVFLNGVKETSVQAAQSAHQILTLFEEDRHKIERLGRPAASVLRIHQHMQRNRSCLFRQRLNNYLSPRPQ
jgi:hypothetical protein